MIKNIKWKVYLGSSGNRQIYSAQGTKLITKFQKRLTEEKSWERDWVWPPLLPRYAVVHRYERTYDYWLAGWLASIWHSSMFVERFRSVLVQVLGGEWPTSWRQEGNLAEGWSSYEHLLAIFDDLPTLKVTLNLAELTTLNCIRSLGLQWEDALLKRRRRWSFYFHIQKS